MSRERSRSPKCRLAAVNTSLLIGLPAAVIEGSVRSALGGTMGCTHLNDVLRFLRFTGALAAAADLADPVA